jgi:hypothetical protein
VNLVQAMTFLHVTFIVASIGMTVFPGILLQQIALSGDAAAITRAFRLGMYHGRVGGILLVVAVIFGFGAASLAHFPLSSGWLIAGYAAVVINIALGVFVHARHEAEVYAAASTGAPDAGEACIRLSRRPVVSVVNAVSGLTWLFALYAMVTKPF